MNPLGAVLLEIRSRYLEAYGFISPAGPVNRLKSLVLITYVTGAAYFGLMEHRTSNRKMIGWYAIWTVFVLTFFAGNKMYYYLIYIVPWLAPMLISTAAEVANLSSRMKIVTVSWLCGVFLIQLGGVIYLIGRNELRSVYEPAIQHALEASAPSDVVMGPAEAVFGLHDARVFKDDLTLGFYSGLKPRVIITSPFWQRMLDNSRSAAGPVSQHVARTMDRSVVVFANKEYHVYRLPD